MVACLHLSSSHSTPFQLPSTLKREDLAWLQDVLNCLQWPNPENKQRLGELIYSFGESQPSYLAEVIGRIESEIVNRNYDPNVYKALTGEIQTLIKG